MIPIEVNLIDYTGMDAPIMHGMVGSPAASKLIYTKATRLEQGKETRNKVGKMTEEEKLVELDYMANTIPSSWEFVNYTFEIKNVTRAFTHQFVRTRTGSYAQQTMRLLDKKEFTYRIPPDMKDDEVSLKYYNQCMDNIQRNYDAIIKRGVKVEDARGVLPTNIHTNIIAQFNLRTVAEMARSRTGVRTQDEYREVMDHMIDLVLAEHPWATPFLLPESMKHIKGLESFIENLFKDGAITEENRYAQLKHLDKLRKGEQ